MAMGLIAKSKSLGHFIKRQTRAMATALFMIVLFVSYQNCSKGFGTKGSSENATESLDFDPGHVNVDPGETFSDPLGPQIYQGLEAKTLFRGKEGAEVSISISSSTRGLKYRWTVNRTVSKTTEAKLLLPQAGEFDVTVEVSNADGRTSASRAIYQVSYYSVYDGQLYSSVSPAPLVEADLASLKPLGIHYAVDKSNVYFQNQVLTVANSLGAELLDINYIRVNNSIYYSMKPIVGAAASSFKVLSSGGIASDGTRVYCQTNEIYGADGATYSIPMAGIWAFGVDKNSLYVNCQKFPSLVATGFSVVKNDFNPEKSSSGFFKSNGKYYYITGTSAFVIAPMYIAELPWATVDEKQLQKKIYAGFTFFTDNKDHYAVRVTNTTTAEVKNVDVPNLLRVTTGIYSDSKAVFLYEDGVFTLAPGPKPDLKIVNGPIFVDSSKVWYQAAGTEAFVALPNANPSYFRYLTGSIYIDNARAWIFNTTTRTFTEFPGGVDTTTFRHVGRQIYADKSHTWYANVVSVRDPISGVTTHNTIINPLTGVDPLSLTYLGTSPSAACLLFTDKNGTYRIGVSVIPLSISSKPPELKCPLAKYAYDNTSLYYIETIGSTVQAVVVTGAPGATAPVALDTPFDRYYSVGTKVVTGKTVVNGVRGDLLKRQGTSDYWTDGTAIVSMSLTSPSFLLSNKGATFRFFDENVSNAYATDGTSVWYEGKPLSGADVPTFTVKTRATAEDKNNTYSFDRATPK